MTHLVETYLRTLFVTALSAAIMVVALMELRHEARNSTFTLGTLSLGTNHTSFHLGDPATTPCFGEVSASIERIQEAITIKATGWIRLAERPESPYQEFSGELLFNPLDQLGGAMFNLPVGQKTLRIGTTGINPFTLHILLIKGESKVSLFKQELPGPIEIIHGKTSVRITAPNPSDLEVSAAITPLLSKLPLQISHNTEETFCSREASTPLPVAALLAPMLQTHKELLSLIPQAFRP